MNWFVLLMLPTAVEGVMAPVEHVIGFFLILLLWVIGVHNQSLEGEVLEV